jgi:hypothetical protein
VKYVMSPLVRIIRCVESHPRSDSYENLGKSPVSQGRIYIVRASPVSGAQSSPGTCSGPSSCSASSYAAPALGGAAAALARRAVSASAARPVASTSPTVPVSADEAEAAVPPAIAGTWRPAASCSAT